MRAAGFCSECGEKINFNQGFLPLRTYCARCAPRLRSSRIVIVALALLCVAAGFMAGWYAKPREPFYFIGTPVDLASNRSSPAQSNSADQSNMSSAQSEIQPSDPDNKVEHLCGAPTKSGRPCRRKVRGGGYCYQHRDKFPPKQPAGEKSGGKQ